MSNSEVVAILRTQVSAEKRLAALADYYEAQDDDDYDAVPDEGESDDDNE